MINMELLVELKMKCVQWYSNLIGKMIWIELDIVSQIESWNMIQIINGESNACSYSQIQYKNWVKLNPKYWVKKSEMLIQIESEHLSQIRNCEPNAFSGSQIKPENWVKLNRKWRIKLNRKYWVKLNQKIWFKYRMVSQICVVGVE